MSFEKRRLERDMGFENIQEVPASTVLYKGFGKRGTDTTSDGDLYISDGELYTDLKISSYTQGTKVTHTGPPVVLNLLWTMSFAGLGALTRIGIEELFGDHVSRVSTYGSVLFEVLISNMVGSFLMGLVSAMPAVKEKYPAVAVGFTTGYCGSVTSFSTWSQQMTLLLFDQSNGWDGSQTGSAFIAILIGVWLPVGSFIFGQDVSVFLKWDRIDRRTTLVEYEHHVHVDYSWSFLDKMMCVWLVLALAVPSSIAIFAPYQINAILLASTFAPFGAAARYLLGVYVPKWRGWFPSGTFIANQIGCVLIGIASVYAIVSQAPDDDWIGIALFSFNNGFVACLTTVSSFVNETVGLYTEYRRPEFFSRAHIYVFVTIVCGLLGGVLTDGIYYFINWAN